MTQANLGAAQSEGDAIRSLGALGPGIAGPIQGGMQSFMEYNLLKPMLDKLAGNDHTQEARGRGIVQGTQSAMSMYGRAAPLSMAAPMPEYSDLVTFT